MQLLSRIMATIICGFAMCYSYLPVNAEEIALSEF